MHRRAAAYALGAVLAVSATVLAVPASSALAVPQLAGTVTLSGSTTGYVPVVVPKEAVLPGGLGPEAAAASQVTGGGAFAGFALVQDGLDGTTVLAGHSKATADAARRDGAFRAQYFAATSTDTPVPAGRYRLYLVTDGEPAKVTLKFRGLTGTTSLTPTTRTRAVFNTGPLAPVGPAPAGGVYSTGHAVTMTTPFLHFFINELDTQAHTETVSRTCFYPGRPTGPMPYGPACASAEYPPRFGDGFVFPTSDENVNGAAYHTWGGNFLRVQDGADQVTQDFGAGISVTTASVVKSTDYTQVWLELNPAAVKTPAKGAPPAAAPAGPPPAAPPPGAAPNSPDAAPAGQLPATGLGGAPAYASMLLVTAGAVCRLRRHRP